MSQYDSHELQQLADSSMFFSPEQKDSLRQLAEVKVLQNQNKGISQVSNDISFGLRGNTPKESHRGIQDYQDLITTAVAKQDPQLIETVLTDLEAWTHNHANKSEAFKQAADMVGSSNKKVQVVALGNNDYRLIQDPKQFLSAKELRSNGGFEFHKGSNQSNVVERVASEAQLIGRTYQALSNYASSFSFNQENNNPESNQNTETTNSASTNSIDIPETQLDSAQPQQDITPPSLDDMELVFNRDGVGSVQPKNLSQENTDGRLQRDVETSNTTAGKGTRDTGGAVTRGRELSSVQQTNTNIPLLQSERDGDEGGNVPRSESRANGATETDTRTVSPQRDAKQNDGRSASREIHGDAKSLSNSRTPNSRESETVQSKRRSIDYYEHQPTLTTDETNVVNSEQFKNWFGDINAREKIDSRGVRGEGIGNRTETTKRVDGRREATGERTVRSDDSRQDAGRVDGDNQTSTRRKITIGGETYQGNVAVTDEGKPQLWFHGTAGDFVEFDLNHPDRKDSGWLGTGVYLTDSKSHANDYANKKIARTKQSKNIMRLYTNASNFLELSLDDKNTLSKKSRDFIDKFTEAVKAKGYEGIVLNHGLDYGREIVVFNPEQVKHSDGRNLSGYVQALTKTASVPALQDIDKAKRLQERSKPFKQRNLITAHFDQSTKTNNPLVSVANFISSLKDDLTQGVQPFVQTSITEQQQQQLQHYLGFHQSLADTISKIFKLKDQRYRYEDYSSFLVNAEGQLDENTLTALTLAAYSTFIETGAKTLNSNAEIAALLHLDEDMYIPSEVADQYRNVGQQRAIVIHNLGKKAAQFLGLKVRDDSDPKFQSSLEGSLGALVYMALRSNGLIEETTVRAEQHVANRAIIYAANNQNDTESSKTGFEYAYVRTSLTSTGKLIAPVDAILQNNKGTQGFLSKLFGNDVGLRAPLLQQPTQFEQRSIAKTSSVVSSTQAKNLRNAQKNGFKIRPTVAKVMQDLLQQDQDYLLDLLGIAVTDQALDALHITQRENFKAKAENEQKALFNAFDFINGLEFKDGEYQTFWDTQYTSSNNRMYYNSNLFNVQSQQIHRTLAALEAFKSSFDPSEAALDAQGNSTGYGKFLRAIAENMEGLENTKLLQDLLPDYQYLTVDKVPSVDFIPAFQTYLSQDYVQDAIQAMQSYIQTKTLDTQARQQIQRVVQEGGMGVQSLYALISLAEHQQALQNKDQVFTTYVGLGSDGVNNGVAIANILGGVASENMRLQVGLIPKNQQHIANYFDTKAKGIPDYYVEFAQVINQKWAEHKQRLDPKQVQALEALFPSWGKRKMAKVWAVPFNYNASFNRLKSVMAEQFITDIYAQMTKIANLAQGKAKTSMQYQEALSLRNALQANLNTLLGKHQLTLPAPALLNDYDFGLSPSGQMDQALNKQMLERLFNHAFSTFGQAAEQATRSFAGEYIKRRDLNVAMHKAAFKIYAFVQQKVRDKVKKAKVQQGLLEANGYEGLSTADLAKIRAELLDYAPILTSPLGQLSDHPLTSGLFLSQSETALNQQGFNQLQISHYRLDRSGKTQNIRVGTAETTERDIGIAGLALQVQSVDAAVSSTTIGNTPSINVHDANIAGISTFEQMAHTQNQAFFDVVGFYRAQAENAQMLLRTLQGVRDLAPNYAMTQHELTQMMRTVLGDLPQVNQRLSQDQQGLFAALVKSGLLPENTKTLSQVLAVLIDSSYAAERTKVAMLKQTAAVHQYAGEQGEFALKQAQQQKLDQELTALETAQQQAHADNQALAAAFKSPVYGQVSQPKQAQLTPLQSWFEQHKNQSLSKAALLQQLRKGPLSTTERAILDLVESLIPNDLQTIYQDADFEGYGLYDTQTNTITIKSVASQGSQVDQHLIIHELLHSALAKRIAAIRANPRTYPEAKQALDKLEALRQEILDNIEQNKQAYTENEYQTLQGMLENVDEFISYGLTDQRLQSILQGIAVARNGRAAPNLRDRFRVFMMAVAKLLSFPKSKHLDALTAFALDTAELIQQAEAVIPSEGLDAIHFQRSPATKKSYEDRINQIFDGKVQPTATDTLMLDRSDVLDLLGFGGYEVRLYEKHAIGDGLVNHPEITREDWLNVPEWLDHPALVVRQVDTKGFETGKLTFFTGEFRAGKPIVIGLSPADDLNIDRKQLTVTMFAAESHYVKGQLERGEWLYQNKKSSQALLKGLPQTSYPVGLSKDKGTNSIKTEADLKSYTEAFNDQDATSVNYRKAKQLLEHLVAKKLTTKTGHISGVFSLTSVKQSLENVVLTEKAGLPKNVHYVILQQAASLFGNALQVTSAQISYFAAPVPVASQGKVFVAWFKVSERKGVNNAHNIIEFVKVAPLDPTKPSNYEDTSKAYYKQFKTLETKLQQQSNPSQSKLKSQYSFDAVQDDGGVQFAQEVVTELSEHDELFKYPKSNKTSLKGIFADVLGDAIEYKGEVTAVDERQESTADHKYLYRFKNKDIYVYERDTGEVWIDVSRLQEGDIGSGIYSAVGNYTYNTGKVFIGDPAGLSDAAVVRRTSAMLSLALKFESTRFMEPSVEQRKGDDSKGVASLKWGNNEVENLRNLIQAFVDTTSHQLKGLDNYYYDFKQQGFFDGMGRPLSDSRLRDGARYSPMARTARAGEATIKRAIVLKSLISSQSSERPRILEQFLSRSQSLKARGLEGIFYSQYAFDATEHVNSQDSLDIFEQLDAAHNSLEHVQHLDQVIQQTLANLYRNDVQAKQQIDQVIPAVTSDAIAAGFEMSVKEDYVQQATKLVLDEYLALHSGGLIGAQIKKTFEAAQAQLKAADFYQGAWETATSEQKQRAQQQYDYLFHGEKDFYSRFLSMALSHEQLRQLLQQRLAVSKVEGGSLFDRIAGLYHYMVAWLTDRYAHLHPTDSLSKRVDQLVQRLTQLDIKARQHQTRWFEQLWEGLGKLTTPLNQASGSAAKFIFNRDLFLKNRYKSLRSVGKIAALSPQQITEDLPQSLQDLRNRQQPNQRLGTAMELLAEVASPSQLRQRFDALIRETNLHAKQRKDIADNTKKALLSAFREQGKNLSKAEHKALSYSVLRTDLQQLLGTYEMDQVVQMIGDVKLRQREVAKLERAVLADQNGNDMLIRAKQLAYYMISNQGGEGLVKNALAIASGVDTAYQVALLDRNDARVQTLDHLISLYALDYVEQSDLKQAIELLEHETQGVQQLIQLHHALVTEAYADFAKNPLSFNKGYLPEIVNPYRELAVASSQAEQKKMLREGWKLLSPLQQDPMDERAERYLMLHSDRGYQRIVSGAVDLMNSTRKGTEVFDRNHPQFKQVMKRRAVAATRRAKQSYQQFDPRQQASGLIASYDAEGQVLAYNYELSGFVRDTYLERNHNFADLMGTFAGINAYKPANQQHQSKVVDVLYQDYKDNYAKDPKAYVFLSAQSTDPKLLEMWRMLPLSFRQEAVQRFGKGKPIVIRNDVLNLAFGFKKYSVAQMFDKLSGEHNFMEKLFVQFGRAVFGDQAQGKIAKAEHVVQEIVRLAKDIIVIRSVQVLWGNIIANSLLLLARGINPAHLLRDYALAFHNARQYQKSKAQLIQLETQVRMQGASAQLNQAINKVQYALENNPLHSFIQAGMLSSIVEDVVMQEADYSYSSAFKQRVDEFTKWIPSPVKTTADWLMVSPKTAPYQFLATTTQLSDFVAKYTLFKHLTEQEGKSFEQATTEASQTFINYDMPTSRSLQYMNDVGLFMFTKFFLRIQAALFKLLDQRAASVIGQHLAVEMLTDVPGILDPLLLNRLGNNPFEGSAASIFSALGENPVAKVVF